MLDSRRFVAARMTIKKVVIPTNAGIHYSFCHSREIGNQLRAKRESTSRKAQILIIVILAPATQGRESNIKPPPLCGGKRREIAAFIPVIPAQAGIHLRKARQLFHRFAIFFATKFFVYFL